VTFSEKILYVYKEKWVFTSKYLKGDWVKGSNNKLYKSIKDGGEAQDPVTDSSKTYWILADNQEHVFANSINDTQGQNGINIAIEKINRLIEYINANI